MIHIEAKNFTIQKDDYEAIESKLERLLHLGRDMSNESTRIRLELEVESKDKNLILGSLTITLPHHDTLRAEAREKKSTLVVTDLLMSKIKSQIEKHHKK